MMRSNDFQDTISIVLCGEAGQGLKSIEYILAHVLKLAGYYVFSSKEYMSRVRGGSNSTQLRISSHKKSTYVERIDILLPLDDKALDHLKNRITDKTIIIGEKNTLHTDKEVIDVDWNKIASDIGNTIYANTIAAGVILGLFEIEKDHFLNYLKEYFNDKDKKIIQKNIEAGEKGFQTGKNLCQDIRINIQKDEHRKKDFFLNGSEAIALGAIAGGCNFISAYPMSPSTGVLVFLASQAEQFGIIVEQAEDEISAINMALGGWYAGARAIVSTSGGGFTLMGEGLSLAGMIESPLVVHLGQRPGPATGLPTRTEQGDLNLAIYSGHGEFPRIVLAPGTIQEAFNLTKEAFNLADKYQVPVIILSDQFLVDSYYNIDSLQTDPFIIKPYISETNNLYNRFAITENGISPRGIPGFGTGLVCVDSDEHNEAGFITEDMSVRTQMVNKRLKKIDQLEEEPYPKFEFIGNENYTTLLISWGSTYHAVKEALEQLQDNRIAFLHLKQVYPLAKGINQYLEKASRCIMVEANATAQMSQLIQSVTSIKITDHILKYDGLPLCPEEITQRIKILVTK